MQKLLFFGNFLLKLLRNRFFVKGLLKYLLGKSAQAEFSITRRQHDRYWAIEGILRTKLAGILTSDCPSEVFQQSLKGDSPEWCSVKADFDPPFSVSTNVRTGSIDDFRFLIFESRRNRTNK